MKENQRKCVKCGASPSDNPSITLRRFPRPGRTNAQKCELWAKFCFPDKSWHSTDFQRKLYNEHRMLCLNHFSKTSFIDDHCSKLFKSAVPEIDPAIHEVSNITSIDPIEGPSEMAQPLLENINILNQATKKKCAEYGSPKFAVQEDSVQSCEKTKSLMKKCKKHIKRISKLQNSLKKLKNKSFLEEFCKSEDLQKLLKTKVSPAFALLLQGQIKNYTIKRKARRWDRDSKVIALRIYKRSPTCYRLLSRIMCLPAPSTLKNLLNKFKLNVGIIKQIFKVLKKKIQVERSADNEYILMFDEMSIKKNLQYNVKEDKIEGYQDHANHGRTTQIASYALVFMIAGVKRKIKQPIAFYLSGGSVTADRLAVLVKEVLRHCFDVGIRICATVCDMDGVNKRALGILGATVEHPSINIDDNEIVTLFDTPHLLKCFRNLFLKYDIECPMTIGDNNGIGVAKWSHVQDFYKLDNSNPNFVFAPSLKQEHLNPNCKQKMKVKLAAQVLSHSVAAGMFAKIAQGELTSQATVTAELISKIDNLFDSLNSHTTYRRRGKQFATNIQCNSPHLQFYKLMKDFFKNIKFLECKRTPPSQEGWVWTLNGFESLVFIK